MSRNPKIELTFGKNDQDLYSWILGKDLSNATFVKRVLREEMNRENGAFTERPRVESAPVIENISTITIEPENEPDAPKMGFLNAMQGGNGGRDF